VEERNVEMIAPHKDNRCRAFTQEGRALRRYRKRWKIERLFEWLGSFRRFVVHYEQTPKVRDKNSLHLQYLLAGILSN
jgi:transposase